jgi:hypothetical protein
MQVIFASGLGGSLKTFGWSLSGGMDLDGNKYPDLLVGAYESGHVVHLRAAPVAHVTAQVVFQRPSKQIDLEEQECTLRDRRTRVPCVGVAVSLSYTGMGVPNKMDFDLEYILDAKKEKQKRLFFLTEEGQSLKSKRVSLLKDRGWSENFKVYLPGASIDDKLTGLDVQARYALAAAQQEAAGGGGGGELLPVLAHGDHLAADTLNIQKECGADNICIPNLSIKANRYRCSAMYYYYNKVPTVQ